MKKNKLLYVLFIFTSYILSAQPPSKKEGRSEKVQSFKIAFISDALNLTASEAEKFWPIYNKYDKKLRELERGRKRKLREKIKEADGSIDGISEKNAKSIINTIASIDIEIHQTKLTFNKELKKVLTYKKLLQLKISEKEFVRKLMKKYKRRTIKK